MGKNSKLRREVKIRKKNKELSKLSAKENKMKYIKPDIFFDESGNTGGNLLDREQPVFTLGSCDISLNDALKALELTGSRSPKEAHFKNLRKRKSGQDGIIRLLESKYVSKDNVKVFLVDKRYMLTTKIVDILIESWSHNRGVDIYINGQNLAISNVLYWCIPVFCGEDNSDFMYEKFAKMIKVQDSESIADFYSSVEELKKSSNNKRFVDTLDRISVTSSDVVEILKETDKSTLDPAIPSLFKHCIEWGKKFPNGYYIKHDDSKAINEQKELFDKFMNISKITEIYGYDRRKFELPIKARSLTFHSSEEYPQLQVADIISSAAAYYVNCLKKQSLDDYLFKELERIKIDEYFQDMVIWPTTYVTPEDLGTVHTGGINAANGVADFLR